MATTTGRLEFPLNTSKINEDLAVLDTKYTDETEEVIVAERYELSDKAISEILYAWEASIPLSRNLDINAFIKPPYSVDVQKMIFICSLYLFLSNKALIISIIILALSAAFGKS